MFLNSFATAQWISDPSANTRLVIDPVNPINLTALRDLNGGAYVFWEDSKASATPDVYFIHINKNGESSFRSDGKLISTRTGAKENPVAALDNSGNSIVIWAGKENQKYPEIYAQKLTKSGLRLWQNDGLQISETKNDKSDYSLKVDKNGISFLSYVNKSLALSNKNSVRLNRIDQNGRIIQDTTKGIVYSSNNNLSQSKVIPDGKGGCYVLWVEAINQRAQLKISYIDSLGNKKWGSAPVVISRPDQSVINYSADKMGNNIYATISYGGQNKTIYHQLVSDRGKLMWGNDGKLITFQKGNQSNPQFVVVDSTVVISWTNESSKVKDVFIQRFDYKGNRLWGNNGKRIINIKGDQFGQRLIYDQKGNVIVAWIDRRDNNFANLYIQKISLKGDLVWDSLGVKISSSQNKEKSYLNLVSDSEGGAIAVFKLSGDSRNDIYGQKIYSTGTYASQILGLTAEVINDSVKINWYAANETEGTSYSVYRSENDSEKDEDWTLIGTLNKNSRKETNYYEISDMPEASGTVYYRVIQKNNNTISQISPTESVEYFRDAEKIILAQNYPNPFADKTKISFYLPDPSTVSFEIFNSNIEIVKQIDNEKFPAGKNEITFEANGLPAGIYFYRLKSGKFVDVKKMIISKEK